MSGENEIVTMYLEYDDAAVDIQFRLSPLKLRQHRALSGRMRHIIYGLHISNTQTNKPKQNVTKVLHVYAHYDNRLELEIVWNVETFLKFMNENKKNFGWQNNNNNVYTIYRKFSHTHHKYDLVSAKIEGI